MLQRGPSQMQRAPYSPAGYPVGLFALKPNLDPRARDNVSTPHHLVDLLPLTETIFTAAVLVSWSQSGARLNSSSQTKAQGK